MRCKLKLDSITERMVSSYDDTIKGYKKKKSYSLKFYPVMGDNEENKKFFLSTPSGTIELTVVNAEVVEKLVLEGEYFVDFTLAE